MTVNGSNSQDVGGEGEGGIKESDLSTRRMTGASHQDGKEGLMGGGGHHDFKIRGVSGTCRALM